MNRASQAGQKNTHELRQRAYTLLDTSPNCGIYSRLIDLFLIALILINVLAVILETVPSLKARYGAEFYWLELTSIVIFTIEYLARFWVAPEAPEYRGLVAFKARLKFSATPMSIIDLIAIAPYYLSFVFNIDMRFLRILRLFRIFKLTRYSEAMTTMLKVLHDEMRNFIAAIFIMLVIMIIAASGIYMMEHDQQPEVFGSIPQAMWWSIVTLTTVGYGDVYPITFLGKVFAAVIMIAGVGLVALPTGILASSFSDNLRRSREKMEKELADALVDGRIDRAEAENIEDLRKEIGLTNEQFLEVKDKILDQEPDVLEQATTTSVCPHCGKALTD